MKYSKNIVCVIFALLLSVNAGKSSDKNKLRALKSEILFIQNDNLADPNRLHNDILNLGYSIDVISPDSATADELRQYSLVFLSTGKNSSCCQSSNMRLALQSFIIKDLGKVIVEGGHTGYVSAVFPTYLGFRNKVLFIEDWIANCGGNLVLDTDHSQSLLATVPNVLPSVININCSEIYEMDVCTNSEFSELFYGTTLNNAKAGIIVAPNVSNPRVINYLFDYQTVADRTVAVNLLQNSIYNLIGKPVSITNLSSAIPVSMRLDQNYPNPFNPVTSFEFGISKLGFVSLKIYNILGKEVMTLVNGKLAPGKYKYNFDASDLPGGVYLYRLQTDDFSETRKMTLIK